MNLKIKKYKIRIEKQKNSTSSVLFLNGVDRGATALINIPQFVCFSIKREQLVVVRLRQGERVKKSCLNGKFLASEREQLVAVRLRQERTLGFESH